MEKSSEEGKALVCFAPGRQLQLQCLRVSSAAASHSKQQNHRLALRAKAHTVTHNCVEKYSRVRGRRRSCRCPPHPYSPLSRPSARPPVHHVYPMPLHHTGLRKVCVSPQIHINGEERQRSLQHSTVDSISAKGWFSSALVGGGRSDKSKEVLPQ